MKSQVLLIGVEDILHNYISLLLKKQNIDLKIARNRKEAEAWLKDHSPDLIITEYFPGSLGRQFRFNGSFDAIKSTPLVVMTASPVMTTLSFEGYAGMTELIEMPFHPMEFMAVIKVAISRKDN